tara:strand:- start:318 stop:527 length:210 start_codon:yes stop_codon:yes gene_type:complete
MSKYDLKVQEFIDAHRPDAINADWINLQFGNVAAYIEHIATCETDGSRYIEIPASDSITGNPIIFDLED